MMAMLKQFQSNPPPAQVKAVEEICVTCGGSHPYYQCLAAGGKTFPEYQDNIQVGKFTFPADFVVVDYKSDHRVPLILGRPFLRTARALINIHGEEMILRDGDERLSLNIKHDTTSYSNHPRRESINLINIFNIPSEDCLEDLVPNKQNGNPTFSLHKEIASPEVIHEIHDSKGCTFLSEELPNIDSLNDIHPYFDDDPLSGSTTYSANSLLEDELLIDPLDLPCDILSEYDSFNSQDFSRDVVLPSFDNKDKVFNLGILSHDRSVKIITRVTQEKKLAVSYASLLFEDFDPPIYELLIFKEVPNSMRLLPFSSENEEKVFKPGIYTFKKFHHCFLSELSHPGFLVFKVNQIFISLMKIFPVQNGKNTPLLDVLLFYFYPP
nr:reverse transcriptase domain-containing protein [Tanacetum cinerariifolium]